MPPPKHLEPRSQRSQPGTLAQLAIAFGLVAIMTTAVLEVQSADDDTTDPPVAAPSAPSTPSATTTPSAQIPPLPSGTSYIASAVVPRVAVFNSPLAGTPKQRFSNPWYINGKRNAPVPLVFHVSEVRTDGWLRVLLPVRPNSSTGWIQAADVKLTTTKYRITVELSAHRLIVYRGSEVVVRDTVAIGAPKTPTPTGRFYIRALLKAPNPNTPYGPFAYGLSGHSEVLQEFAGGDA